WSQVTGAFGADQPTFASDLLDTVSDQRMTLWRKRVEEVNWELLDRGVEMYTWYALEEVARGAKKLLAVSSAAKGTMTARFIQEATQDQLGRTTDNDAFAPFVPLRENLEKPFKSRVFFWQRQSGPKGDLVDDEMGRVLKVPGWSNIFTQPIINRIEMLS